MSIFKDFKDIKGVFIGQQKGEGLTVEKYENKDNYNNFACGSLGAGMSFSINQLPWNNKYISNDKEKFELVCGLSDNGPVTLDLVKQAHILIAGLSGYGKSVLETCLAWQSIKKGARLYMADFKCGVELGPYDKYGEVLIDRKRALEVLRKLTDETRQRMDLFKEEGVRDINEYNSKYPKSKLSRVIFICDEVAEMLDITALEEKAEVEEIIKHLSTIARLGRAPGVNLILVTGRPDAKVISGQIKANMVVKMSTRMIDNGISEMAIGNTKAAELPDIKGRFVYTIGVETIEFQAFAFNTSYLELGKYVMGKMLTSAA